MENIKLYKETNDRIADLLLLCEDNTMCLYAVTYIKSLEEQIKNYEDLEEKGKLLKLPCAVGDFVYKIKYGEIESHKVVKIELEESGIYFKSGFAKGEWPFCTLDNFGKNVFLTREESEAALEELERGKGE